MTPAALPTSSSVGQGQDGSYSSGHNPKGFIYYRTFLLFSFCANRTAVVVPTEPDLSFLDRFRTEFQNLFEINIKRIEF